MKIKIKNEMHDIRLKLNHKELTLIKIALSKCDFNHISVDCINNQLFDKDELNHEFDFMEIIQSISRKIDNKTSKINVW